MPIIAISPYENLADQLFQEEVTFRLSANTFQEAEYVEGRSVFVVSNCIFKKISLVNEDIINFNEITIAFNYCVIDDVEDISLVAENVSLLFHGCIIQGRISSPRLTHVDFNNCIFRRIFFSNQKKVSISYTEDNIFPILWKRMLDKTNTSLKQVMKFKQYIHVIKSKNLHVRFSESDSKEKGFYQRELAGQSDFRIGYFPSDEDRKNLNIHLRILFADDIEEGEVKILNCRLGSLSLNGESNGNLSIERGVINNNSPWRFRPPFYRNW